MTTTTTTPRIYVACLAAYNDGFLHGAWIDADAGDLTDQVAAMLAASPIPNAEEYAIHDHDEWFGWSPGEYTSLGTVATVGQAIAEHGLAFGVWVAHDASVLDDPGTLAERFEESYLGEWASVEAYAYEYAESAGWLAALDRANMSESHFDVGALARDLVLGGDITAHPATDGGVYVFGAVTG